MKPAVPLVPFRRTFPAQPSSAYRARQAVKTALLPVLWHELAEDLVLLTSELVTNAVRYGPRPAEDHVVEVTLWHADSHWWLAVSDAGDCELPSPTCPGPDACGGRGLFLLEVMSAVWTVLPRPRTGKTVVAGLYFRAPKGGRVCSGGAARSAVRPAGVNRLAPAGADSPAPIVLRKSQHRRTVAAWTKPCWIACGRSSGGWRRAGPRLPSGSG